VIERGKFIRKPGSEEGRNLCADEIIQEYVKIQGTI